MKTAALFLSLLLAACATRPIATEVSSGVRFAFEPVSPEVLRLTLDNGSTNAIGYNLCASTLQRRDGSGWIDVPTNEICTMQILTLQPGADATFEKRLPALLEAGEYRYVTFVENPVGASSARVATREFLISPD